MKVLLFMMVLSLPAMGQRRLWTWTAPALAGDWHGTGILAAASDSSGATAAVLGEYEHTGNAATVRRVRLLWISAKGTVLHESTGPTVLGKEYLLGAEPVAESGEPWKILFVGAAACVITDGERLFIGSAKGKAVTMIEKMPEDGGKPIAAGWTPAFQGWMQRHARPTTEGVSGWGFDYRSRYNYGEWMVGTADTLGDLSLWSLK